MKLKFISFELFLIRKYLYLASSKNFPSIKKSIFDSGNFEIYVFHNLL